MHMRDCPGSIKQTSQNMQVFHGWQRDCCTFRWDCAEDLLDVFVSWYYWSARL